MTQKQKDHVITNGGRTWTSNIYPCSLDLETVAGVFCGDIKADERGNWCYTIVFKSGATAEAKGSGLKTTFHEWQQIRVGLLKNSSFKNELESLE